MDPIACDSGFESQEHVSRYRAGIDESKNGRIPTKVTLAVIHCATATLCFADFIVFEIYTPCVELSTTKCGKTSNSQQRALWVHKAMFVMSSIALVARLNIFESARGRFLLSPMVDGLISWASAILHGAVEWLLCCVDIMLTDTSCNTILHEREEEPQQQGGV